jgi:hypothetical protein
MLMTRYCARIVLFGALVIMLFPRQNLDGIDLDNRAVEGGAFALCMILLILARAERLRRLRHLIRHYGLLAASSRKASLDRARALLAVAPPHDDDPCEEPTDVLPSCPCCGGPMVIVLTFARWQQPRAPPQRHSTTGTVAS